ncbi:MAG: hypothetical protein ACH350_06185 [Parachlamydiaceae bacterium]
MNEKHCCQEIKHEANEWVAIAKKFGEDCIAIQKNAQLSIDEKLNNQHRLGDKIIEKIGCCDHFNGEDKQKMIQSIHDYLDEWKLLHHIYQTGIDETHVNKEKIAVKGSLHQSND